MCGIFFYIDLNGGGGGSAEEVVDQAAAVSKLAHRGPDASTTVVVGRATLGFHRLAIVAGGGDGGMQPMRAGRWALLCNGEVYNHAALAGPDGPLMRSDVDVVLLLLARHDGDAAEVASRLDGDFAFVAYDAETSEFVAARDPIGVRPLFYGIASGSGEKVGEGIEIVAFASEAKALCGLPGVDDVRVFPPGHAYSSKTRRFSRYFDALVASSSASRVLDADEDAADLVFGELEAADLVFGELEAAVKKRIEHGDVSDVVGVLCSGGVDSAAITCIARRLLLLRSSDPARKMKVFTMRYREGRSDDAFYAGLLCAHLGVDHRTFEFGPEDLGEETIAAVIRACETCDPNTVRAAVPMYLLAKAIRADAREVKVVLSGEGADELFGGYNYFRFAPDAASASDECDRLLRNLHMFDLLRADRCFAAHGLEVRVPFLDPALVQCVRTRVTPERRVSGEKQLLRDAVAGVDEALSRFRILDRPKEKFSDGAGFTYVPDLLRRIASTAEGGDDGTLGTRLAAEKALYRRLFDREFSAAGPSRDAWVVARKLPGWEEVDARQRLGGGAGSATRW